MDTVAARSIAERDELDLGRDLAPLCLGPAPRFRLCAGEVLAVGPTLATTASRPVALSPQAKLLAATSDLRQIIAVDDGKLVITTDTTLLLAVPAADSATFLRSGLLLVTAPNIEHQTWRNRTIVQRTTHRVLLIDPRSGAILDEIILDGVADAGVFAIANPADGSVLLNAGEGQDGSEVFTVRDTSSQIRIEHLLENVVTSGFSPDGDRLLVLPHPSFEGPAIVASWPSMDPIGTASPQAAGINDDAFDLLRLLPRHRPGTAEDGRRPAAARLRRPRRADTGLSDRADAREELQHRTDPRARPQPVRRRAMDRRAKDNNSLGTTLPLRPAAPGGATIHADQ